MRNTKEPGIRGIAFLLLVIAAACTTAPATRSQRSLWAELEPGEYKAGFRSAGAISIWYPATSGGEPMRFRDFYDTLDEVEKKLHAKGMSSEAMVELFDTRMYARRDAIAAGDIFRLVAIEQRKDQTAADHAVLAEFLASHGYIVASVPPSAATAELKPLFSRTQLAGAEWLHGVDFTPDAAMKLLHLLDRQRTR